MVNTGIPIECVKKTSAKTGNNYLSINLGAIGTLVVYLQTSNAVLYPRDPEQSQADSTVVSLKKAADTPFFNDPLPDFVS